jgi:hypothetical protein
LINSIGENDSAAIVAVDVGVFFCFAQALLKLSLPPAAPAPLRWADPVTGLFPL